MQLDGYEIMQNDLLCEDWEVPDFSVFKIVAGLKEMEIIKY